MVSLSNHVAIPLRLNTRRQTTVATPMRLPRCARNDRVNWGTHEGITAPKLTLNLSPSHGIKG